MRSTLGSLILLLVLLVPAQADRYYGNANLAYSQQFGNEDFEGYSLQQQQVALNYEDVLFYKNHFRLGFNLFRAQQERSNDYSVRPIYSLDLTSYGYSWRSSYSPYSRKQVLFPGEAARNIYTHEVRNVLALTYPKYPTFSVAYTSVANFDREPVRGIDTRNRNLLTLLGYSLSSVNASLSYNRIDLLNQLPGARDRRLETFSSAVNGTKNFARFVTVSSGYSFYDTKSQVPEVVAGAQTSQVHALTALASTRQVYKLSALASYSGNFFTSTIADLKNRNSTQSVTGQLGFYPTDYASLEMLKSYQITDEGGNLRPLEYLSFTGNLTRYLRRGVNTRLSVSRIIYQQSDRTTELERLPEKYTSDTYYGSLGFRVARGIRVLTDLSLSHTDRPLAAQQRYQIQRMVMAQLSFSRSIEGRVTASWISESARLDLFKSQTLNYNYGMSWTPNASITATAAYSYNTGQSVDRAKYGSLSGYFGYSFRRAFAFAVAVNQQNTERLVIQPGFDSFLWRTHPTNINTTLTVYFTKTITGTVGYTRSKTPRLDKRDLRASSLQVNLNMRF